MLTRDIIMSRAFILEGFDIVGKTTYSRMLVDSVYRPDYSIFDQYFDRTLAFMFGYAQADTWSYCKSAGLSVPELVGIDRSPISGYVYSRLYGKDIEPLSCDFVISYLMKMLKAFDQIEIYDVRHSGMESAEEIYDYTQKYSEDHNEPFDTFDSFSDYYNTYSRASIYFDAIYGVIKERLNRSILEERLSLRTIESYVDKDNIMRFRESDSL